MLPLLVAALALSAAFLLGAWIGHSAADRALGDLREDLAELGARARALALLDAARGPIPCPKCGPGSICMDCRARMDAELRLDGAVCRVLSAAHAQLARTRWRFARSAARRRAPSRGDVAR